MQSMAIHVRAMLAFKKGAVVFDYGNNLRARPMKRGSRMLLISRAFVRLCPPLFCEGKGPFRWRPFGGSGGHLQDRRGGAEGNFRNRILRRWIQLAREKVKFQGLPAGSAGWVTGAARIGKVFNDMVARGELKAPIVIGRTIWMPVPSPLQRRPRR